MQLDYEKNLLSLMSRAKGLKILCVDDNALFLETLKKMLTKFHFDVVTCESADEAYELYIAEDFDIVMSDIYMPGRDGLEFIREIREKNPFQVIAIVSAFNDLSTLQKIINIGATKFISKPLEQKLFIRTLYELCEIIYNAKQLQGETVNLLQQYKNAIDVSSIVTKSDLSGKITYANENFCQISQYSQEELIGRPHSILRSPNMEKKAFQELWDTIQAKKIWQGTVENRKKHGQFYTVYATIIPILDQAGEIVEYISIRQDITELKKLQTSELSEKVAKASSIHLQSDIELFPLPTLILDEESKILHMNQLFEDATYDTYKLGDSFEKAFVEKSGYIKVDPIFDWKHDVIEFNETDKLLLSLGMREKEFTVHIKRLEENGLYVVSLCEDIFYE